MKHLKLFKNTNQYESYKNGSDYVLPNVSYVEGTKGVKYERRKPKTTYTLRATYNATPDNLVAFTGAPNIKALTVNGTSIKFEPVKNEFATFDVLGENISMNLETGEIITIPESYLLKSPVSNWSFKAKDPNYTINENTYVCMLKIVNELIMVQPISFKEVIGSSFTTNDGVTLEVVKDLLDYINGEIQNGTSIGFVLADKDMINNALVFIDTEHQTNVTTGGLLTYSFDSEGFYDVKIELADPTIKMSFAETPLTSIEIGNNITTIGNVAFWNCVSLTSVTIGHSVTSIGQLAFKDCSSLTSITIPDSVTEIGSDAFYNCSSLSNVTIPNSVTEIKYQTFYGCSNLTSITIPNSVTSIEGWAFNGCNNLTSITIPDSVTSIGDNAFSYCTSMTSVYCKATTPPALGGTWVFDSNGSGRKIYVPAESIDAYKSATNWSEYASTFAKYDFENGVMLSDYKLEYTSTNNKVVSPYNAEGFNEKILANIYKNGKGVIYFDNPITSIGSEAFYNCTGLTSITIPDSVTSIGREAFAKCNFRSIIIPDSVTEIGERAFWDGFLKSITIPDSVTTIGDYAFQDCSILTSVTIGDGVTTIGDWAFEGCSSLTSINIPNSVTEIGERTFSGCSILESVIIPDSVTTIGSYAFCVCGDLTSVTIPDSVTSIGDSAFSGCDNLKSITIGDSVTTIGNYAFDSCYKLANIYCKPTTPPALGGSTVFSYTAIGSYIYVPAESVDAYKSATYWSNHASRILEYNF